MNEKFMKAAIKQANLAKNRGEVPIGAVITKDGKVVARGFNLRETSGDATAHAELFAIKKACKKLNSWRLSGCEIYVTLEPCLMCMGAILNARIDKLYFGSYDDKRETLSAVNLSDSKKNGLNHNLEVQGGLLKAKCDALLNDFFSLRRSEKKADKI